MANNQGSKPNIDRYVVIHVATTCDEHGVFVTKDSAEVIELGWILLDAKSAEEVRIALPHTLQPCSGADCICSFIVRVFLSSHPIHPSPRSAVSSTNRSTGRDILPYTPTDESISELDNPHMGTCS